MIQSNVGSNIITGVINLLMMLGVYIRHQVRYKPACTVIEDGYKLEILDLYSRGIALSV